MSGIHVLKLGGGAGNNPALVLKNLAARIQAGERWVLVHGCSAAANELAERVGYTPQMLTHPNGHTSRHTDSQMIEIFSAAAALVNQTLSAELSAYQVQAVGLAGPNIISAERKTAIRALVNGRQVVVRDDYSGSIKGVWWGVLSTLLEGGNTPVIAPLAMGKDHERLNVDGDLAAAHIARALGADSLIILSNVPGLLKDVNQPESLIKGFRLSELEAYESYAAGRMKKKLLAAQAAQVSSTILADSRLDNPLDAALAGGGTHIAG